MTKLQQNFTLERPKWTVLYNIAGGKWVGTGWEFFDTEAEASDRYKELCTQGHCPCKRPYHNAMDAQHLGAAHRWQEAKS